MKFTNGGRTPATADRYVSPNAPLTRTLTVTASASGFVTETAYSRNGIDFTVLSRTLTPTFPLHLVARCSVGDRADVIVKVRAFTKGVQS